jgi:mRNA interferase MazF
MSKDFNGWNHKKQEVHNAKGAPFFHEREVWWCSLGVNVGSEQDGTGANYDRPVVVVRGFNKDLFFGVALTGKKKRGRYYFPLGQIEGREATAVLSQVRLIDAKRLVRKAQTLNEALFAELKTALRNTLLPLN